ncbi:hypothetical protein SprV_0802618400 [Sparganum proliferum]
MFEVAHCEIYYRIRFIIVLVCSLITHQSAWLLRVTASSTTSGHLDMRLPSACRPWLWAFDFYLCSDAKPVNLIAAVESVINQTEAAEETKNLIRHQVSSLLMIHKPREILPKVERDALIELKADKDTVIVPADKGCSTVLLDRTDYLQKAENLLEDRQFYVPCETNPVKTLTREINATLLALENSGAITPTDRRMARAHETALARFYGLPKVHKESAPLRPIVLLKGIPTPKFWARYVDDTFVVIERDQVLTFKERLNSVFSDIQFMMEEEGNNQLVFLDVLVCRKDCGGLKTKMFRKATNMTQILNFNSNHQISHKRRCVRTLYRRVETHCSEPEDKVAESQYLRRVFRENGYPRNFVNRCMRKRDERQNRADPKFWRAIPYIKKVSEAVSRLLAPLGVGVAHRPEATMRRQVMRPKDPLPWQETSRVVYRIWCSCGQSNYVGETGRLLRTRIAEHVAAVRRNDANSQVAAHSTRPGHTFKFDEAEILARGDNRVSRELLKSWFTGPQSINKCNDIPAPYSVLRHRLAKVIDHPERAQAVEPDARAIITPASNTGDEITAINNLHAGHRAIIAPAGNNP